MVQTIEYSKPGTSEKFTLKADSCSGEVPAYSHTYFWIFYKGKDKDGRPIKVGRIAERNLDAANKEKAQNLYGYPWRERLEQQEVIELCPLNDFDTRLEETCWQIFGLPPDEYRIYQNDDGVTLYVMNNGERFEASKTFEEGVKKLFPNKKIRINVPVTTYKVIEL